MLTSFFLTLNSVQSKSIKFNVLSKINVYIILFMHRYYNYGPLIHSSAGHLTKWSAVAYYYYYYYY